jgi:hypothetical protein
MNASGIQAPRFQAGTLLATPQALRYLTQEDIFTALCRHVCGDWGDVDQHDKAANNVALIEGMRLLSAYKSESGVRFWILTEADRSSTTIQLPEEY